MWVTASFSIKDVLCQGLGRQYRGMKGQLLCWIQIWWGLWQNGDEGWNPVGSRVVSARLKLSEQVVSARRSQFICIAGLQFHFKNES